MMFPRLTQPNTPPSTAHEDRLPGRFSAVRGTSYAGESRLNPPPPTLRQHLAVAHALRPPRMRSVRDVPELRARAFTRPILRLELSCGHVTFLTSNPGVLQASLMGTITWCAACDRERDV